MEEGFAEVGVPWSTFDAFVEGFEGCAFRRLSSEYVNRRKELVRSSSSDVIAERKTEGKSKVQGKTRTKDSSKGKSQSTWGRCECRG